MRIKGGPWQDRRRSAVAIRHVAFEDLGTLAPLLDARGWSIAYSEAATDQLHHRSIRDADLIIILDGPIAADRLSSYRFLTGEMHLIERRLARGLPVLGIGLGARLMAAALGGRIFPGAVKQIGWSALSLTPEGLRSPLAPLANPGAAVLHRNGDDIDLPPGARRLAFDSRYANQAFSCGPAGLGLQFHLEADPRGLEEWYVGHSVELGTADIDPRQLRRESRQHAPRAAALAQTVFGAWLDQLPDGTALSPAPVTRPHMAPQPIAV